MATKSKIPFAEQLAERCKPYFDELKTSTIEDIQKNNESLFHEMSTALKDFEDALAEKSAEDVDKAFTDLTTDIDKYLNERDNKIQETLDDMSVNVAKLADDFTEVKDKIENPPEESDEEMEADAEAVERKKTSAEEELIDQDIKKEGSKNPFEDISKDIKDIKKNVDKAAKEKYKIKDFLHDAFMFFLLWLSTMNPDVFKKRFSEFTDSVKEKFEEAKAKVLEVWENDIKPAFVFIREIREFLIGAKEAAEEVKEGAETADTPEVHVDGQGHVKKWEAAGAMLEHAGDVEVASPVFLTSMLMGQKPSIPANERGVSESNPDFVGPILHRPAISAPEATSTAPIEGIDTPLLGPSNQSTQNMYGTQQASTNISSTTNTTVVQVNSRQDAHNG